MSGIFTRSGTSSFRQILPGDLIIALNPMRSWESPVIRGNEGDYIKSGEQAFVLTVNVCGNCMRMSVLRNNRIMFFSCKLHTVHKNWKIAEHETVMPTSGSARIF